MRKNKIIIICIAAVLVIAIALTTILAVNCNGKDPTPDPTPMEAKLESISLDTSAAKIEYAFAETFTTEGLKVTAKMSDGTTKDIALSDCTIKEPDTGRAGKRTVTVSYKGKTATYKITVNKRVYPSLGQDALLTITGENDSVAYRVEAENISVDSLVKGEGVTSLVKDADATEIVSGGKYLQGYGVKYNYFGFKINSDAKHENVTMVIRAAYKGEKETLPLTSINAYLNNPSLSYADDSNEIAGNLNLGGTALYQAKGWSDIVLRNVTLLEGENTLVFDVPETAEVPAIDYIDFYVGMRYISTVCEIAEQKTYVMEIEDLDTEKAATRSDVAEARGLKAGELFVEANTGLESMPTSGGKSVGAIAKGSQLSTTLRVSENATINFVFIASRVDNSQTSYYVADNWKFYLDGVELQLVERANIIGGDSSKGIWWDWKPTSLGIYNVSAGDHLFTVNATGMDCNVDCMKFEVVSLGSYDESGINLKDQHVCKHVCDKCGKCTDSTCTHANCTNKCEGHVAEDIVLNGETAVAEFEDLKASDYDVVTRPDFMNVYGLEQGQFRAETSIGSSGGKSISGFMGNSVFRINFKVETAGTYKIEFVGANDTDYPIGNLKIELDGVQLSPSGNLQGTTHDDVPSYYDWQNIEVLNGELAVGDHVLTITVLSGNPNFDCVKFTPVG